MQGSSIFRKGAGIAVAATVAVGLAPGASAAPTTTSEDTRLTVTENRIGKAFFPASVWKTKTQVNPHFGVGRSTLDTYDECLSMVTGEPHYASSVRWSGFSAFGVGTTKPVRIDSYTVSTGTASRKLRMPYGVNVGNSVTYLKAKVGWMRIDKSGVFNEGRIYSRGDVYWFMTPDSRRVQSVIVNPHFCD